MMKAIVGAILMCIPLFSYAELHSKTDAQQEELSSALRKLGQAVAMQNKNVTTAGFLLRNYAKETGYLFRCVSDYEKPDFEKLVNRYIEWAELEKSPEFKGSTKEIAERETFSISLIFSAEYMTADCAPSIIHAQRIAADINLSRFEYLLSKPIKD